MEQEAHNSRGESVIVMKQASASMRMYIGIRLLTSRPLVNLILILSASYTAAHSDGGYSHDAGAVANYPNWMSFLSDDTLVTGMSWPGTHDSMSLCNKGAKGDGCDTIPILQDITQTQSMDLLDQLNSGIRALDIRIKHQRQTSPVILTVTDFDDCAEGDTDCIFPIYHGAIYLGANFEDDVMDVIVSFLATNPSESVLVRLKEEGGDFPLLAPAMMELLNAKYSDATLSRSCWLSSGKLGNGTQACDARGKVLIMPQGFGQVTGSNSYIGYFTRLTNGTIQDDFSLSTNWELYDKWIKVKNHFMAARDGSLSDLYFNFLSGAIGSFPYFVASGHSSPGTGAPRLATGLTTPGWKNSYPDFPRVSCFIGICTIAFEGTNVLAKNLLPSYAGQRIGAIMADFPGKALIEQIIQANIDVNTGVALSLLNRAQNRPPVANIIAPGSVNEGSPITFDATSSSDPDGDMLNYEWELLGANDCTRSAADGASIMAYNDALEQFAMENPGIDPTVLAIAFSESEAGKSALQALNDSPDELGKATYVCSGGPLTATVKVAVSDLFEEDETTANFSILNVPPSVTLMGDMINEDGTATIQAKIADPGVLDTFEVDISWGDGVAESLNLPASAAGTQSFQLSHQYLDDDPTSTPADTYTVDVTATDKDGSVGAGSTTVSVANVAPMASIDSFVNEIGSVVGEDVPSVLVCLEVLITASFSDIGTKDTHIMNIDWGDGTSVTTFAGLTLAAPTAADAHFYMDPGMYPVTTMVTDDDNGVVTASRMLNVLDYIGALKEGIAGWDMLVISLTSSGKNTAAEKASKYMEKALEKLDGGLCPKDYYRSLGYLGMAIKSAMKTETTNSRRDFIVSQLVLASKSVTISFLKEARESATKDKDLKKITKAENYVKDGDLTRTLDAYKAVKAYRKGLKAL